MKLCQIQNRSYELDEEFAAFARAVGGGHVGR